MSSSTSKKTSIVIKKQRSRTWEYKISPADFVAETSAKERYLLRQLLDKALITYLEGFNPVYLENFGILFPIEKNQTRSLPQFKQITDSATGITKAKGDNNEGARIIQNNLSISVTFEKCSELINIHRENHPNIIEVPAIAQYIYSKLPLKVTSRWKLKTLRRLLRGTINTIREEVVVDGFSSQIPSIGDLFALHNRQGNTPRDWYAGANIVIVPRFSKLLNSEVKKSYKLPILSSSWEIFEAAYGEPAHTFKIDLKSELNRLGYDISQIDKQFSKEEQLIHVAAFQESESPSKGPGNKQSKLIFVTNGLQKLTTSDTGCELTVQLPTDGYNRENLLQLSRSLITLGWVLIQSHQKKTLTPNCLLCAESGFIPASNFSAVFTTKFNQIKLQQKTKDGIFRYTNLTGITEDEFRFGNLRSPEHLHTLLKCKSYDQVSIPTRRTILGKYSTLGVNTTKIAA